MPGIPVTIGRGTCHVLFAYEVGLMIDLDRAARVLVQAQRGGLLKDRRNPAGFDFRPLPLRVVQQAPAVEVAGTAVGPEVEATEVVQAVAGAAVAATVRARLSAAAAAAAERTAGAAAVRDRRADAPAWVRGRPSLRADCAALARVWGVGSPTHAAKASAAGRFESALPRARAAPSGAWRARPGRAAA